MGPFYFPSKIDDTPSALPRGPNRPVAVVAEEAMHPHTHGIMIIIACGWCSRCYKLSNL